MVASHDRTGPAHTPGQTPVYQLVSTQTLTALSVGGVCMAMTILGMLLIADTALATAGEVLFRFPLIGVLVFGAMLTAGRALGMRGIGTGDSLMALSGASLSILTYAWFGGMVLTPYDPALYWPAISIAGAITVGLSLVAAAIVYATDFDFRHWARYSGICFGVGIGGLVVALVFPPLVILTFGLFLLGFFLDLVYEIWMTSNQNRSPVANGLALYIAFAGVFVHVIQLVLRALARTR